MFHIAGYFRGSLFLLLWTSFVIKMVLVGCNCRGIVGQQVVEPNTAAVEHYIRVFYFIRKHI